MIGQIKVMNDLEAPLKAVSELLQEIRCNLDENLFSKGSLDEQTQNITDPIDRSKFELQLAYILASLVFGEHIHKSILKLEVHTRLEGNGMDDEVVLHELDRIKTYKQKIKHEVKLKKGRECCAIFSFLL